MWKIFKAMLYKGRPAKINAERIRTLADLWNSIFFPPILSIYSSCNKMIFTFGYTLLE